MGESGRNFAICTIVATVRPEGTRGGPLGFNRDVVVLAELDVPDKSATNAQLDDLLQPGGERVEPAAEYEARDASRTIRVIVDAQRRLSDVDIQHRWTSRIPADQLAEVLFDTYVQAVQRAMVVELANAGDTQPAWWRWSPTSSVPALDGAIGGLVTGAIKRLGAIANQVMDTLGNIRDAKSLMVDSRLPGGQWPQAVNL